MTSPHRSGPGGPRPPNRERAEPTTFTRSLRYELAGEEGRALVGSYAISFTLAALFLLFVYLSDLPAETPREIPEITFVELEPIETPEPPQAQVEEAAPATTPRPGPARPAPAPRVTRETAGGDVGGAFAGQSSTGGFTGNVAGALRGVDISSGTAGAPSAGTGSKAVISGGAGTGTAATPGRGGVTGDAATGGAIGRVTGAGGVGRAAVSVASPSVVRAPDLPGPGRDMGDLGAFVRSRMAELQFCYQEHGLKVNPQLAGTVNIAIGIGSAGNVTSASVQRRTWSGAGASAVESCVLSRIRGWRFPRSATGDAVYAFPFNFTR
ncbi:MAG TPA: AgmX/PglI C-terminal domain-containing protein [Gemmatimonadaceae bacterium]|nr:AgmX/PglI C-terminal domain-containing protein [Gemmatimonadaceae bacterium]